jgi:hypothetical protein
MPAAFNIRADLKALTRDLDYLSQRQIPFATAQTLTAVAREVAKVETEGLRTSFDTPTPFTMRAVGVIPARKATLTATVFVKDRQAKYLAPQAFGGRQFLGAKRAILMPRDVALNTYGNIPRGRLAALKGQPGVFVGQVRTRTGLISGVWQRPASLVQLKAKRQRGVKLNRTGHLRLLIQFTEPREITPRLPWDQRARATVAAALGPAWRMAIAAALASAH